MIEGLLVGSMGLAHGPRSACRTSVTHHNLAPAMFLGGSLAQRPFLVPGAVHGHCPMQQRISPIVS